MESLKITEQDNIFRVSAGQIQFKLMSHGFLEEQNS